MTSFFMAIPAKLDFEIWPMANTMNQAASSWGQQRIEVVANSIPVQPPPAQTSPSIPNQSSLSQETNVSPLLETTAASEYWGVDKMLM